MSREEKLAVWETHVQEERDNHTRFTGKREKVGSYPFVLRECIESKSCIQTEPIYLELFIERDPSPCHKKPLSEGMGYRENSEQTGLGPTPGVGVWTHSFSFTETCLTSPF